MREIPKTIISILLAAMVFSSLTIVAMAGASTGNITRTINKHYIDNKFSTENITVTLTPSDPSNETTFDLYLATEDIPENLNVNLVSQHAIVVKNGTKYDFFKLVSNYTNGSIVHNEIVQYNISINKTVGTENNTIYQIKGTFNDSYPPNTGTTNPASTRINIGRNIELKYDVNMNYKVDRNEVISGIWDYFFKSDEINYSEIVELLYNYFAGTSIL